MSRKFSLQKQKSQTSPGIKIQKLWEEEEKTEQLVAIVLGCGCQDTCKRLGEWDYIFSWVHAGISHCFQH